MQSAWARVRIFVKMHCKKLTRPSKKRSETSQRWKFSFLVRWCSGEGQGWRVKYTPVLARWVKKRLCTVDIYGLPHFHEIRLRNFESGGNRNFEIYGILKNILIKNESKFQKISMFACKVPGRHPFLSSCFRKVELTQACSWSISLLSSWCSPVLATTISSCIKVVVIQPFKFW